MPFHLQKIPFMSPIKPGQITSWTSLLQYNANFIHIIHNAKKFKHNDRLVIVRYNWIYLVIFTRLNLKYEVKVECDHLSQDVEKRIRSFISTEGDLRLLKNNDNHRIQPIPSRHPIHLSDI